MTDTISKIALFCDEAGKETDRYLAVGGLVVTSIEAIKIRREFLSLTKKLAIASEVKWNKIKKGNKDKYQEIIHFFFGLLFEKRVKFHCLLIDFERFDHNLRADGGKNESLKRMYYQLILHRLGKKHGMDCHLYAFPDKANELVGLDGLKLGLNSVLRSEHKCKGDPIKAIEFRDSESEPLLQLNDLILGAVCYQKNRRFDEEAAGQAKSNLSGFVLGKCGLVSYEADTPRAWEDFSIWNLKSGYLKGS